MGSEGAERNHTEAWVALLEAGQLGGVGHQPLPAMFARPDSYAVVGRSKLGDRIAFKTADPAEAAAFAARLVRDRPAAAQLKAVQVWSAEAEAVLRDAGWHPGRSIDTAPWRARRKRTASGSTPPPRNCYASSAG